MKHSKKANVIQMGILLLVFWVIIESDVSFVKIAVGVFATLFVVFYSFDLIFEDRETNGFSLRAFLAFLSLIKTMIKEVIVANVQVAALVLSPKMPISPEIVKIKQPLNKDINRAFYGNFITLTPGTLTIDSTPEYLLVHGLTKNHVKDLSQSPLQKAFVKLEGENND